MVKVWTLQLYVFSQRELQTFIDHMTACKNLDLHVVL